MHAWRLGDSLRRWAHFPPLAVCHCEGGASWPSKLLAIPLPQPPVSPTECWGDRQGTLSWLSCGLGGSKPRSSSCVAGALVTESCPQREQTVSESQKLRATVVFFFFFEALHYSDDKRWKMGARCSLRTLSSHQEGLRGSAMWRPGPGPFSPYAVSKASA